MIRLQLKLHPSVVAAAVVVVVAAAAAVVVAVQFNARRVRHVR